MVAALRWKFRKATGVVMKVTVTSMPNGRKW